MLLTVKGLVLNNEEAEQLNIHSNFSERFILGLPHDGKSIIMSNVGAHVVAVKYNLLLEPTHPVMLIDGVYVIMTDKLYEVLINRGLQTLPNQEAIQFDFVSSELVRGAYIPFGSRGEVIQAQARLVYVDPAPRMPKRPIEEVKETASKEVNEGYRMFNGYKVYEDGTILNSTGRSVGYMLKGSKVLEYKADNGKKARITVEKLVEELFNPYE